MPRDYRILGYMNMDHAQRCYWCYRILCRLELIIGRKIF